MSASVWTKAKKFLLTALATMALVLSGAIAEPASAIPALPGNPFLAASSQPDFYCTIHLVGGIPANADPGTTTLSLDTADSGIFATLNDQPAHQQFEFLVHLSDAVNSLQNSGQLAAIVVAGASPTNLCAKVTLKLSYKLGGVEASTTKEITPELIEATGTVIAQPLLSNPCKFHVLMTTTNRTDFDRVTLVASQSVGGWDVDYNNVTPNKPLDIVIDISDQAATQANPRVNSLLQWGAQLTCSRSVSFNMHAWVNGLSVGSKSVAAFNPPLCAAGTYGVITPLGWDDYSVVRDCLSAQPGTYVDQPNALGVATPCAAGSFAPDSGSTACNSADPGSYVATAGQSFQVACPAGTYSEAAGAVECTPAPIGFYVTETGSTSATACPAGFTTELTGARSIHECYRQKFQTAKAIRLPAKLKFGATFETAARTDAGLALNATVTGPCTISTKSIKVKINGKKVTQPRYVIKAGKSSGTCKVTYTSDGDYTYKVFTKTRSIKITK